MKLLSLFCGTQNRVFLFLINFYLYIQTPQQTYQEENIEIRTYKKQKSDNLNTA
jgi:hypothetical protein